MSTEAGEDQGERFVADELVAGLGDPAPRRRRVERGVVAGGGLEPLKRIEASEFVRVLTGRVAGRDGKVRCPFHADRTPSLHCYPDHFYCFGCRAGGDVYDFGARLLGVDRDADFPALRRHLYGLLLPGVVMPSRVGSRRCR